MVTSEKFENEVSSLQSSLRELHVIQGQFMETYKQDMDGIQTLLRQLVASPPGTDCSCVYLLCVWVGIRVCTVCSVCVGRYKGVYCV